MLKRIIRHEWRTLAADRTLHAVAAVFVVIVGYGVWNGANWVRGRAEEAHQARATYDRKIADLRTKLRQPPAADAEPFGPDPRAAWAVGSVAQDAVLPAGPLGALSVGQADLLPGKVSVNVRTPERALTRNYEVQNPLNLLAGRFDLAFAIVYLFPLLILGLSYNLLSGERDAGTLALLLSQPVALGRLVAGKVIARFLLVVGLGVGLSLLGLALAGTDVSDLRSWSRIGLWTMVVLLYGAFWFSLAGLVSARGLSSAANAVVLAGAWLAFVVVLPALLSLAAASLHPVPSRAFLVHAMRDASNDANQRGSELMERYFQDHPELAPEGKPDFDDFSTRYLTMEREIDAQVAPVLASYDAALQRQQRIVSRLRFLSPAIAVQEALNDVAGTGRERQRSFLAQATSFLRETKAFFVPRIFRKQVLTEADYDAVPKFSFVEETAGTIAGRVLPGLAGTVILTAIIAWLGWRALQRSSVVA